MFAVHLENGAVSVRSARVPRRPPGFSLVRVLAAGICNTDLELQAGYYGFRGRPGHEFVGEVAESDRAELIGKRVAGEINISCGQCDWCARGLARHCPSRTVLGIVRHPGAFAEFLTLPDGNLHVIPRALTTEQAVFIEPVAAACEILDQVAIPRGEPVAVLGDGKLGLLIAQVLHAHGAAVVLLGHHREKLALAAACGIETRLAAKRLPVAAFPFVVDATGSREGLSAAIVITRPRGTVILKSTVHGLTPMDAAPVIVNEITLVGSRCGRFEAALRVMPKLRLDAMIADRFPLDQAPQAFRRASEPGALKVLLIP